MNLHNQLLLLHLFLKHIRWKKPIIDYFQPHILTFTKYLFILRKKIHGQGSWERFFFKKWKEEKFKQTKKVMDLGIMVDSVAREQLKMH